MDETIEQKVRLEAMEHFECTEQEYADNQKAIEDSIYYGSRLLYYSLIELGNAFEQSFKRDVK